MPSSSKKQHNFMEAVKHSANFARKARVPQSVGEEFAEADDKAGITKTHSGEPASSRNSRMKSKMYTKKGK